MSQSRQVRYHTELKRGDHISFYRRASFAFYYHHAIVVDVKPDALIILSFTNPTQEALFSTSLLNSNSTASHTMKKFSRIQREAIPKEKFLNETVYVYDYEGSSYSPDTVIRRALSVENDVIEWDEYDLVSNNCEHFATWCKTGQKNSKQVETVGTLAALAVGGILAGLAAYNAFLRNDKETYREGRY